jgi:LuxR family transcriptional regulator, quorum-sensing system regulator RaiR
MRASRITEFLEKLEETGTADELQRLIETIRDIYDVENAVYHAVNLNGAPYAAVTYRPAWADRYHEKQYVKVDPVVRGALQQFHPMDWKRLDWSRGTSRAFLAEAIEAGVGNQGYSIPIRGPNGQFALFTINQNSGDDEWQLFTREFARDFLLISHHVHQKVLEVTQVEDFTSTKDLSPREIDALTFLGAGLARSRIADQLQISEHTLRVYIDAARYKLGALNTTHAVAMAISKGVINI